MAEFKGYKIIIQPLPCLIILGISFVFFFPNYITANRTNHWNKNGFPALKIRQQSSRYSKNDLAEKNQAFANPENDLKATSNNTHPPLFWSYYNNAARTVEKVSTEQGLNCIQSLVIR